MLTHAFHDRDAARVSYSEALTGATRYEEASTRRPIEDRVADQGGVSSLELRSPRQAHGDLASAHALRHIIVGLAHEA
jgi:hypothetical protein